MSEFDAVMPPIRDNLKEALSDLHRFGVTRYAGAMDADFLARTRTRLVEQAEAEDAQSISYRDNSGEPEPNGTNQRIWNLLNKGEVFKEIVTNTQALTLIRHLLGPNILLFSATANIAGPGGPAQVLHGDQLFAPVTTPYPLLANCLWMLDEFTEENGATRVVPDSHLAKRWPEPGEAITTFPATGPAGTIMVWDGRLWHGTGANTTKAPRHGLLVAYCLPFVRQQENATLSTAPNVLATCSDDLLGLLGFRTHVSLGMIDGLPRNAKSLHGALGRRPDVYSGPLR